MRQCRLHAAGIEGVDGYLVMVEGSRSDSLTGGHTTVVGLPDSAVRESIDRVIPACFASGLHAGPGDHLVINLAPANRRKEGPAFDLAIALALACTHEDNRLPSPPEDTLFLGELALDGTLRPVSGTLAACLAAREAGLTRIVTGPANASEAAVVSGMTVCACPDLRSVVTGLRGCWPDAVSPPPPIEYDGSLPDLADVRGQAYAKRALAIAAAGGHNLLMIGPPGSGKTMLARRLPGILPDLSDDEALAVTRIHSVAGTLPPGSGLLRVRPFRAPHHTISDAGLVGGGSIPRPGEVSLAHYGVLFLDELPEFNRRTLETLRQPLEDGFLTIARAWGTLRYPARCMLVAAMNPCPCGFLGHPSRACSDNKAAIDRYRSRISGPLIDRIDIHVEVPAQDPRQFDCPSADESSAAIRQRIVAARTRMLDRQGCANAELQGRDLRHHARPESAGRDLLHQAIDELGLSGRAHDRILRVARSIADIDEIPTMGVEQISEAIGYRLLDRQVW